MSKISYHYAPMTGSISKYIDGIEQKCDGWPTHHEWTRERCDGVRDGHLVHTETINYGHPHFHGRSGRVDVFEGNTPLEDSI